MLSLLEQALLTDACRSLPVRKSFEVTNNYVLNMLSMALDFQLRQRTVDAAFAHFKQNHRYRSHRRLRDLAESFDNTKKGNLGLARTLWNNKLWTRAQFLRLLLKRFEERGVRGFASLSKWVERAEFDSDVRGQFKTKHHSMGYTMFQYLRLKLGHDTVKPDSRVICFVSESIHRKASPKECVEGIETAGKILQRSARELDAAIYSREVTK